MWARTQQSIVGAVNSSCNFVLYTEVCTWHALVPCIQAGSIVIPNSLARLGPMCLRVAQV